jgi:hypothetical protein
VLRAIRSDQKPPYFAMCLGHAEKHDAEDGGVAWLLNLRAHPARTLNWWRTFSGKRQSLSETRKSAHACVKCPAFLYPAFCSEQG